MRLEIEITDDEIRSAIELKMRAAMADQANSWGADKYIKECVCKHWASAVDALIADCLNDSTTLRAQILGEIERKMRRQIAVAMKEVA